MIKQQAKQELNNVNKLKQLDRQLEKQEVKQDAKRKQEKGIWHRSKSYTIDDVKQVVELVAKGYKYRDIVKKIKNIGSTATITRIVKNHLPVVKQVRATYREVLEGEGLTDKFTAKRLKRLAKAKTLTSKGDLTEDNKTQLEAVKYIDQLKGRGDQGSKQGIGIRGKDIEVAIVDY